MEFFANRDVNMRDRLTHLVQRFYVVFPKNGLIQFKCVYIQQYDAY